MSGGKLVLVTGGNSGIGLEACKILCAEGHTVVATVRSAEKGEHTIREVREKNPNADIHYMLCEMGQPKSIRSFAEEFKAKWLTEGRMLDILINNAGAVYSYNTRMVSEVNPEWEQTVVVNAMAPMMVTDLLLENLKETADKKGEARVVMVNSSVTVMEWYIGYQTDLDNLMLSKPGTYTNPSQAYKNSKVAFMLATLALVDEVKDTNILINSMCPGIIPGTNLAFSNLEPSQVRSVKCMICCFGGCMGKSNHAGGKYIVDVASGKKGKTRGVFYVRGKVTAPARQVQNKENQKKALEMLRGMANAGY